MTVNEQRAALESILQHGRLSTLFQPIFSLSEQRILGYEALTRGPSNSPLHAPNTLFSIARQQGCLSELEQAARQSAVQRFSEHQLPGKLFLNICPETLLEPQHRSGRTLQLLQKLNIAPSDVVIELTEQSPIEDVALLDTALNHYRNMGFSIALDDLGAGYASLRLWSELRPDYVKIDRHFIEGIHYDALKREFVSSILQMAKAAQARVIAEGIERPEELSILREMGVDLVQGYLLARPLEQPPLSLVAPHSAPSSMTVGPSLHALLQAQPGVLHSATTCDVLERFQRQPALNSLAVIDEANRPVGIIHRHALSEVLIKPYASDLFARKPISRLMQEDVLQVDCQQSLQQVSRLLTSRARQRIEEDFIITQDGAYAGLGRIMDVLRLLTEERLQQARHANPLTQLPGNLPIQQCLERLLEQRQAAVVCYVDLDSFKPFNDLDGLRCGMKGINPPVWVCKSCGGANRAELAPYGDSAKSARARVDLTLQCYPLPPTGKV
ncbi:EAL domain-containing protein [Pseudomonas sp. A3.4]|nr:EAL domain-containing protein [Atopomonas sediminilitoris]MCJ8170093.1 EAL domain-containing protein [Atopomonas sediminilitoris]